MHSVDDVMWLLRVQLIKYVIRYFTTVLLFSSALSALVIVRPVYAATICSFPGPERSADGLVLSDFMVTGNSPARVGDFIRVSFTLTNGTKRDIVLGDWGVLVRARAPSGAVKVFGSVGGGRTLKPLEKITLVSGGGYLNESGTWVIWPSYHIISSSGGARYGPDEWHACRINVAAAETQPALTRCPTNCVCLAPEQAKQAGYIYCEGKQTVCGYDPYRRPMYCYQQPVLPKCPSGCSCETLASAARLGLRLCQEREIVCGYDQQGTPMACFSVPGPPDLHIRSVWLRPLACGEYEVGYTIVNKGERVAPPSVTGLFVDGNLVAEDAVGSLGVTPRDETFSWRYNMASCTPPSDRVVVVADYKKQVTEADEENNYYELDVTCSPLPERGPDLTVRSASLVPLGDVEYKIDITVANIGCEAAGNFNLALYVDGDLRSWTTVSPGLEAGQEIRHDLFRYDMRSCTSPSDLITITADDTGLVTETNERNNNFVLAVRCRELPDLVIDNAWYQHPQGRLRDLTIFFHISNRGSAWVGPSIAKLFINNAEIGTANVPALDPGEHARLSFPVAWTPQQEHNLVEVRADASGEYTEMSEHNNNWSTNWDFVFSCCNRLQDRDEEGIDCGGSHCPPCNRCNLASLPSRFDWRDYYQLPPVRNQRGCGSCWAHAAIGAIEGTFVVENCGEAPNLSEQNAICECPGDCGGG